MSLLPQIFQTSKSQQLQPRKVGGLYSINLRSTLFSNNKYSTGDISYKTDAKLNISVDTHRYRSWSKTDSIYKIDNKASKSLYKSKIGEESIIQQKGFAVDNINSRSQQSDVQAIMNFNTIRKNSLQAIHLANRTLQFCSSEQTKLKTDLQAITIQIQQTLQQLSSSFSTHFQLLYRQFKDNRRQLLHENKVISQQLVYLQEQMNTTTAICEDIGLRYGTITQQFV